MTPPQMRIQLLGAFRVLVSGQPVRPDAWRSRRASDLVKLLALAPHYRLPREQIAETLWPGLDLDAQLNNLNVATTRARGALESAGAPRGVFLVREGNSLALGPVEAVQVDVADFERRVSEATRSPNPATGRDALAQYTGDLLPDDLYEPWVADRRTALRSRYRSLLARTGQIYEEQNELDLAIESWRRFLQSEPADEEAHLRLIVLHEKRGQINQALAQFDQLTSILRRELDTEPQPATIEVIRRIRALPPGTPEQLPTASVPRMHGHLPFPLDTLIGREHELAEIGDRLSTSRLVTLTGPGGIGKTRLAIGVAHEAQASFPDGVTFVDLSPVSEPDHVLTAIAQALDIRGQSGQPSLGSLAGHLAAKHALLVLDNFEQVIQAGPLVSSLLERAPYANVLVTSRVPLHVRGETEYPVPPLLLPEPGPVMDERSLLESPAVALFAERARALKPDFAIDAGNAVAIRDVCRHLDGLPLAIELAAARIKVLSPSAMLARLDAPLSLLTGGARDLPARQQTMRNTIAWSYDLLSAPEQHILRRLSVFVGGWTFESAQAVVHTDASLPIDLLDGLASLLDKHLIVRIDDDEGQARFLMRETIREFAREQLASTPEADAINHRHARYMVTFAERSAPHLEGSDLVLWMRRLDREDANLRAAGHWLKSQDDVEYALRLVIALKIYLFIRGRLAEGCDTLLELAALPNAHGFPELRADALIAAAFLARENGDYDRAHAASAEASDEAARLGDHQRRADALTNLGYVELQRGNRAEARQLFEESLRLHTSIANDQGIADALSFLGLAAYYDDDLDTSWRLNMESLDIWEREHDRQAIVWARTRLGGIAIRRGAYASAYEFFWSSLDIARDLDFRWGLSWSLDGLAHLSMIRGDRDLAIDLILTAATIRAASGLQLPPTEHAEILQLRSELDLDHAPETPPALSFDSLPQRVLEVIQRVNQSFASWPTS